MILLGLTGDIAAGKSTVARLLEKHGAITVDADALVHELYAHPDFAQLVSELFPGVEIKGEGGIDRARLAAHVFGDAQALRRLEAVVHPAVAALRDEKIEALRARATPPIACVLEAVKLIESGQHRICDVVWWIRASPETQYTRLVQQRAMGEAAAKARLAQQPPAEGKRAALAGPGGTHVPCVEMWNDGSLDALEASVATEWEKLRATSASS